MRQVLATALLTSVASLTASCGSAPARAPERDSVASGPAVRVVMDTSMGPIELELDRATAPVSVANFLAYAMNGAYDGAIFHRVVPGFVIQGGGYSADMADRAKPRGGGQSRDKPIVNEWANGLQNLRGTIGMARDKDPDTATRQWFINLADNARLDTPREVSGNAGYAVFGRVVAGMDVVDRIAGVPTEKLSETDIEFTHVPVEPVVIRSVRIVAP
jgi:cyclophilin family peptidyl-prolyl cis-trans isomerase